jgi:hypothetical protein
MDLLTPKDLKNLTTEHNDFCISITMPSPNTVTADILNKTTFMDLLKKAESKLRETKLSREEIAKRLKSGYDFVENDTIWHDGFNGLAVYIYNDNLTFYKLPFSIKERIEISHYYYLVDLVTGFFQNPNYNILIVDEGGVEIFIANRFSINQIEIEEPYSSESDYYNQRFINEEEQFYHVENRGGRNSKHEGVMMHGHGNAKDDRKIRAKRYFQTIEPIITKYLQTQSLPLVIAGHDYLVSIYKDVTKYHPILATHITLNPGPLDKNDLHTKANAIIDEDQKEAYKVSKNDYCNKISTELTTVWPEEIIKAGTTGKIDTLFYNKNLELFGFTEETENKMHVVVTNNDMDEDLTNLAILLALQNDSNIFPLSEKDMPQKVPFCALLRY